MTINEAAQVLNPTAGLTAESTNKEVFEALISVDEYFEILPRIVDSVKDTQGWQNLVDKAKELGMTPQEFKKNMMVCLFGTYMQAKLRMAHDIKNGKVTIN